MWTIDYLDVIVTRMVVPCLGRLMRPWVKPECRCQSGVPIDDQVDELLCREFQDKSVGEDSFKVLGIHWLAN